MSAPQYELAIFGSTPLAWLVAGLLAAEHGKRVVLVSETPSPYRLPSGLDLSAMPITRPDSWALLKAGTAETLKLLRRMHARRAIRRIDPLFVAETAASEAALSHVRQMALGFGFATERASCPDQSGHFGLRFADAVLLNRTALAPVVAAWLERVGVVRLETRLAAAVKRDGSVTLDYSGQKIDAAHAVFADDEAILKHLVSPLQAGSLRARPATAMLLAAERRLAAPLLCHVDRGVTLVQVHDGHVLAYSAGLPEEAATRIESCTAEHGPLRALAQRHLRSVVAADGAPLVGPIRGGKATIVAGFGLAGSFFAPALARYIAGASSAAERAYFIARQGGRTVRSVVSDYQAAVETSP